MHRVASCESLESFCFVTVGSSTDEMEEMSKKHQDQQDEELATRLARLREEDEIRSEEVPLGRSTKPARPPRPGATDLRKLRDRKHHHDLIIEDYCRQEENQLKTSSDFHRTDNELHRTSPGSLCNQYQGSSSDEERAGLCANDINATDSDVEATMLLTQVGCVVDQRQLGIAKKALKYKNINEALNEYFQLGIEEGMKRAEQKEKLSNVPLCFAADEKSDDEVLGNTDKERNVAIQTSSVTVQGQQLSSQIPTIIVEDLPDANRDVAENASEMSCEGTPRPNQAPSEPEPETWRETRDRLLVMIRKLAEERDQVEEYMKDRESEWHEAVSRYQAEMERIKEFNTRLLSEKKVKNLSPRLYRSLMAARYSQDRAHVLTTNLINKVNELKLLVIMQQRHISRLEEKLFFVTAGSADQFEPESRIGEVLLCDRAPYAQQHEDNPLLASMNVLNIGDPTSDRHDETVLFNSLDIGFVCKDIRSPETQAMLDKRAN